MANTIYDNLIQFVRTRHTDNEALVRQILFIQLYARLAKRDIQFTVVTKRVIHHGAVVKGFVGSLAKLNSIMVVGNNGH